MKLNKSLISLLSLMIFTGCAAQKSNNMTLHKNNNMIPHIHSTAENFNIKAFNENGGQKRVIELDSMVIEEEGLGDDGWIKRTFYNESYFSLIEKFYLSGVIMEKVLAFNEGSAVGIWFKYDKNGTVIEEIDTEETFVFGTNDVLAFCKANKIPLPKGYQTSGWSTTVFKEESQATGGPIWKITWMIQPDRLQELTLDGKTGEIIEKKSISYSNR